MEYILLLSIGLATLAAYFKALQVFVFKKSQRDGAILERYLKTGRAKLDVWGN